MIMQGEGKTTTEQKPTILPDDGSDLQTQEGSKKADKYRKKVMALTRGEGSGTVTGKVVKTAKAAMTTAMEKATNSETLRSLAAMIANDGRIDRAPMAFTAITHMREALKERARSLDEAARNCLIGTRCSFTCKSYGLVMLNVITKASGTGFNGLDDPEQILGSGLPEKLSLAERATFRLRQLMIVRTFKFLRYWFDTELPIDIINDRLLSLSSHSFSQIMYKSTRECAFGGGKPQWDKYIDHFVLMVLPSFSADDDLIIQITKRNEVMFPTHKYKADIESEQSQLMATATRQLFFSIVFGVTDYPTDKPIVISDMRMEAKFPKEFVTAVRTLNTPQGAQAYKELNSRMRQNVADFFDAVKWCRHPEYDKVKKDFSDKLSRTLSELKRLDEERRRLLNDKSSIEARLDARLHELDPNHQIKNRNGADVARAAGRSLDFDDLELGDELNDHLAPDPEEVFEETGETQDLMEHFG